MSTLFVVESPAKCGTISKFLGSGYIVIASYGHIRDISGGLSGIDFKNNYQITYSQIDNDFKRKKTNELKKAASNCKNIIIATDPDREGEAIGFHVAVILGANPYEVSRVKYHEITKKAVLEAVENKGKINMDLVRSQEARRVLDLLVGYELSPLVSKFIGGKLSAGRCQSPAVRIVYEREQAILNQPVTSNFSIDVILSPENNKKIEFEASFKKKYSNRDIVLDIYSKMLDNSHFQISSFDSKIVEHAPPKPYTTSSIQQDCSSILHINPADTMSRLQTLYEAGKITYMRTDSVILSKDATKMISNEIINRYDDSYLQCREYKNKGENCQEAHEAIRPTHMDEYPLINTEKQEWDSLTQRVYQLIWKRTMSSQMANQRIRRNTTSVNMYYSSKKILYTSDQLECIIEAVEFDGWRILYKKEELGEDFQGDTSDKKTQSLDDIKTLLQEPKPNLLHKSAISKQQFSRALCRFTEASLIKELESKGIGRPSTYANIMETIIKQRNYVDIKDFLGVEKDVETILLKHNREIDIKKSKNILGKEKAKLTISPLGQNVIKFLLEHFGNIMDYKFTKQVEDELDLIMEKKSNYSNVVDHVYKSFHSKVVELKESVGLDKKGDTELGVYDNGSGKEEPVILKHGKFGYYLTYMCENYSVEHSSSSIKTKIVENEDLEVAVELIEEIISKKQKKIVAELDTIKVGKFEIRKGPYGFYFQHNKKNYGIGNKEPSVLTEQDCCDIMSQKKEWMKQKFLPAQNHNKIVEKDATIPIKIKPVELVIAEKKPRGRPKKV